MLQACSSFNICLVKAHKFVQLGCFFFHYFLATSITNWAKIFTDLLFHALSGYTRWELVFDNYQICSVPLMSGHAPVTLIVSKVNARARFPHSEQSSKQTNNQYDLSYIEWLNSCVSVLYPWCKCHLCGPLEPFCSEESTSGKLKDPLSKYYWVSKGLLIAWTRKTTEGSGSMFSELELLFSI